MNPAPFITTSKQFYSEKEEELLAKNEYKVKYNSDLITIMIGKTKDDIFIRSSYYEIIIDPENLSLLTKVIYKSIDEAYEFIENIFNQNKFRIKEKSSNIIKLIIKTYDIIKGKEKELELCLIENFSNKNNLIKELFNKYMNIEKEINEIKNDNNVINEENEKLKQENNYLKDEIELMKKNHNNDIGGLPIQKKNLLKMIEQFQQQINQLNNQINEINKKINIIQIKNLNNNKLKNDKRFNSTSNLNNNKNNNQNNINLVKNQNFIINEKIKINN